jgi:hypothetical protein
MSLFYETSTDEYTYNVPTDRELSDNLDLGATLNFDATSGKMKGLDLRAGQNPLHGQLLADIIKCGRCTGLGFAVPTIPRCHGLGDNHVLNNWRLHLVQETAGGKS